MKTKQAIYLGLAILLSSASLTNLPTRVSAVESSSSSASISSSAVSQSSAKESSSVAESSKNESSQSVMLSGSSTGSEVSAAKVQTQSAAVSESSNTQTAVASSASARADVTLPGAGTPDGNGIFLGFVILIPVGVPLVTGFVTQPQTEQYVTKSSKVNLDVATTSWSDDKAQDGTMFIKAWQQQTDGSFKEYKLDSNSVVANTVFFRRKFNIRKQLPVGTYYFQMSSSLSMGILGRETYYSKLAKVVVVDDPIPATGIKIKRVDRVTFPKTSYPIESFTNPVNSTSTITWSADQKGKNGMQFSSEGRNVELTPDTADTGTINTSTTAPGIPVNITSKVTNDDNKSITSDPVTTYVGGLKAKSQAQDSGFSWDLEGTDRLQELSPAVGWKYQWHYVANDGAFGIEKDHVIDDNKNGVKHSSGEITSAADINNSSNVLTFNRDSSLMASAANPEKGKAYRFYVTLTPKVKDANGNANYNSDGMITSNLAQLTVTPATGFLSLDAVPDFNFGSIPVSKFYDGTDTTTAPTTTGNLAVSDTRAGSKDWTLSATASKFLSVDGTGASLQPVTIQLSDILGVHDPKNLYADMTKTTEISNNKVATAASSAVTAKLLLDPNPTIKLKNTDAYSSGIIWTLSSTQPTALAAK